MSKKDIICPNCKEKIATMDDEENCATLENEMSLGSVSVSANVIVWPFNCKCHSTYTYATIFKAEGKTRNVEGE